MKNLVFGFGINDANYYTQETNEFGDAIICPYYLKWKSMLHRCYSEKYQLKYPTYKGCTVCEEWKYFMSFKSWMKNQDWKNKELDKDIIILGNKLYSPSTCCFVTKAINNLIKTNAISKGKYPKGIYLNKVDGKFFACIGINGKPKNLGGFKTKEEARARYMTAKSNLIYEIAMRQTDKRVRDGLLKHTTILDDMIAAI